MDAKQSREASGTGGPPPTPDAADEPTARDADNDRDCVVEMLKALATLDRAMSALRQFHMAEATRLGPELLASSAARTRPSPAQVLLAIELSERGPGTISELAARLRVSVSAISLLVDRMVAHGMVERVRGTEDRRVVQVRLTAGASEMASAMLRVARGLIERFVEETPSTERAAFLRHFDRFARIFDTITAPGLVETQSEAIHDTASGGMTGHGH